MDRCSHWWTMLSTSVPVARLAPVAGVGTALPLHDLSEPAQTCREGVLSYGPYLRGQRHLGGACFDSIVEVLSAVIAGTYHGYSIASAWRLNQRLCEWTQTLAGGWRA
jgi:hypothetical protein